jgi:hypothetical protein
MKVVEEVETHFLRSVTFFPARKSLRLWGNIEESGVSRQAADIIVWLMRVAWWASKATRSHSHAHTQICNTYCFSTAPVISCSSLSATLCVHRLHSCLFCETFTMLQINIVKPNQIKIFMCCYIRVMWGGGGCQEQFRQFLRNPISRPHYIQAWSQ